MRTIFLFLSCLTLFPELLRAQECVFRIGVVLPLSGNAAQFGERARDGALLAKDQASAFMPNCKLELFFEDSAWEASRGAQAAQSLINTRKVDAFVTGASHISLAIQPIAAKRGIPQVAVFTTAEKYSTPNDLSLRMSSRAEDEVKPLLDLAQSKTNRKVGLLYIGNDFGEGVANAFRSQLTNFKLDAVFDERFLPTDSDFQTLLLKAKSAGASALLVVGLPIHYGQIVQQAHRLGYNPVFLAPRTGNDPLVASLGRLADSFYFSDPFDAETSRESEFDFVSEYREKFKVDPDSYSAEGFESVRVLGSAWSECFGEMRCVKATLLGGSAKSSVFGRLVFDINGDTSFSSILKRFEGGQAKKVAG